MTFCRGYFLWPRMWKSAYLCFFIITCVSARVSVNVNTSQEVCNEKQFKCKNGRGCISSNWVCDHENDCNDGSDESSEICALHSSCSEAQFKCGSGQCIPQRWQCDNEQDCSDGSDEDEKNCQHKCGVEEFTCRDNKAWCIPLTWMCDNKQDCLDGSDEWACNQTCRSDEIACGNGKCIMKKWQCNGEKDCEDGSDELNCPPSSCNAPNFSCALDKNHCLNSKQRCDGFPDCPDGSDEQDCPGSPPFPSICSPHEFECEDHLTCIHTSWICDGKQDCPNGADEAPSRCGNETICRADQFKCKSGHTCISGNAVCNGHKDCTDGSDELNCTNTVTKCDPITEFKCGENMCIPMESVCDGKRDCPGLEDESKKICGVDECLVNNGNCSHHCINTRGGYYCICNSGFKLVNQHKCEDINECNIPGSCSQRCINELGTFKCECEEGYMRDPQNRTRCKAIDGHASLLFARKYDIRKISLDRHEMTSIVSDTQGATALDFVFRTGNIFWSDVIDRKIYKAPIEEGNERTVVIEDGLTTSDGLAVDWIYNHIYWTDTKKNTIELANFQGTMRKVLIQDNLQEPRAIAVNPLDGWMYWTDWGEDAKIERAGMDGSHRQTIVSYEVKLPNGLTLDMVQKKVYWVDAKLSVISSCNYDGSERRLILYSLDALKHPFSITTFEDWIYWTDWADAVIYKANKFTGQDLHAVTSIHMLQNPMAIHVYHQYRQPDGENHCQAVNGHCSHLCLPAPRINEQSPSISCACPEGLQLTPGGLKCVQYELTTRPSEENKTSSWSPKTVTENTTKVTVDIVPEETNTGVVAGIVIVSVLIVVIIFGIALFFLYQQYLHRNANSMNFDNPVYRKTTTDEELTLQKNAYQPSRLCPSTVGEEANEPLTSPCNGFV